ncbi:MAG: hypothetical protein ACO2ZZ_04215 [Cyclobacteriaceae bacterium]
MKPEEVKISLEKYTILLESAYQQISLAEDPKVYRITRIIYLIGILASFLLAKNFPEYREVLSGVMLLLGIFLLSSSLKYNVKKREQKRAKKSFDQMLYQITEVKYLVFIIEEGFLKILLKKKDGTERNLNFETETLSAFQWLAGAFLITNEEGINFIIPEGLFKQKTYQELHHLSKQRFKNKN